MCKVLVVGDIGTGKTSLLKRYVHGTYSVRYKSTIGVDFAIKVIHMDDGSTIRLQLWDIAGQERFNNMTRIYYRDATAAFVVFDVDRTTSFESVRFWKKDIDNKVNLDKKMPIIIIANKIDLIGEQYDILDDMDTFCKENGFTAWFTTSAKENINIDKMCEPIINFIVNQ